MPREATSVATSTWNLPSSNPLSAPVRCDCAAVAVNHGRVNAVAHQVLGQALGPALGAGEDQGLPFLRVEKLAQHFGLVGLRHFEGLQLDRVGRLRGGTERDAHRVASCSR